MRELVVVVAAIGQLTLSGAAWAKRAPDLCTAVAAGKAGAVQRSLKTTRQASSVRCQGKPVLHHAIVTGASFDVILALLHAGVDVNQAGQAGDTPLILAARQRDVDLVKLLFQYGADPTLRNAVGLSAIDEAQTIGRSALLEAMGVPVLRPTAPDAGPAARAVEDSGSPVEDAASLAVSRESARVDAGAPDLLRAVPDVAQPVVQDVARATPPAADAEPALPTPSPTPVVVEEQGVQPPDPAAPGLGRKLLLFLLLAGGIALAMRLLLRVLK